MAVWHVPPHQGLRVNTLKIPVDQFLKRTSFHLEPIAWTTDGFYCSFEERLGKHPYHQAGLYYLQEPSAMAPVACLDVQPGDKVLDLCGAPGGKTTQIAAGLQGKGLLVTNDIKAERVKSLVRNVERWGAGNVVVANEDPHKLAVSFPGFFDKVLIDAPCSGEGMFRKDERAIRSWSVYNNESCAALQKQILEQGALMLAEQGRLLYSTCTFSPQENEAVVADFLNKHPEFTLAPLPLKYGWRPGLAGWPETANVRRLWPHKVRGEGHFLALLEKRGPGETQAKPRPFMTAPQGLDSFWSFMEENLPDIPAGPLVLQEPFLYCVPPGLPDLQDLKIVRPGLFMGILKKGRFEPSQALAMGLTPGSVPRKLQLAVDDKGIERYLKGETLMYSGSIGWTLVCLEEFPLGWAKQTGNYLKNYYPPGWRLMG